MVGSSALTAGAAAGVAIGRSIAHRLDLRLALGSITEADAEAYVLGVFRDVAPSGAARALDEQLGGAIAEFTARRMYSANVGEVFVLPTGRHPLRADEVLFAGLGPFDRVSDDVVRIAAENAIRVLIRSAVGDFATVLFGAGSGSTAARSLENLLVGFVHGLRDADTDRRTRRITFCETDPGRYGELRAALHGLGTTALFDDVEVTIDEVTLRPSPEPARAAAPGAKRAAGAPAPDPVYLMVRQNGDLNVSLLTAGGKAAVISDTRAVPELALEKLLATLETPRFGVSTMDHFGDGLAALLLPAAVLAALEAMRGHPLVVVHDAAASLVPWEAVRVGGRYPAVTAGLSRRYLADNLSVAKWLERRRYGPVLDLLLVVNPTGDLNGAEQEGARVRGLFESHPGVKVRELRGVAATRDALLAAFRSGAFDAVHYAGHAFFDGAHPERSGLLCHGGEVLSGADLVGLGNLPALVFFNACESGRIRRGRAPRDPELRVARRLQRSAGVAEAFLRGGVANYLGTYWPVGDESAKLFAATFYGALLEGRAIGAALAAARVAVRKLPSVDWADYIHYGDQNFVLKQR